MAESKLKRTQREGHKRYKEDVKREGKPFFPYAMFHDTIMALVVDGILTQKLPWGLILMGAFLAIAMEILGLPSLPIAVGAYLPI